MIFLIFVIVLANRSQIMGWPDIWNDDIIDLPWFGQYPGYPGFSDYLSYQSVRNPAVDSTRTTLTAPAIVAPIQTVGDGTVIQQQPGHSIIIWPGVNGNPPRVEQRPGIITHSTLSLS